MSKELDVVVTEDGSLRFIFDDDLADLIPAGYVCPIRRASHVEPTADGRWTADMRPAIALMTEAQRSAYANEHGPLTGNTSVGYIHGLTRAMLTLGPFATRAEALSAEVQWLKQWAGV